MMQAETCGKAQLAALPADLMVLLFGFLEISDILVLERVSKRISEVAKISYKIPYGSELLHLATEPPANYRELALNKLLVTEEEEVEDETEPPSNFTEFLLRSPVTYCDENGTVYEIAAASILALQESIYYDSHEWTEAVAVAMIAQHRFLEAAEYVRRLKVKDADEGRNLFLTAARFGWPPELGQQPFISPELGRRSFLEKQADWEEAFVGMAMRGDLASMEDLYGKGVRGKATASKAAMFGHVHVLKFLHEHELFPQNIHQLLSIATRNGQETVVEFLLGIGCQPDLKNVGGESPIEIALSLNKFAVLRILINHSLSLKTAQWNSARSDQAVTIDSGRFASFFTCADRDVAQRIRLLKYFVHRGHMDINELDAKGRGAIHHAVRHGNIKLIQAVMALGANIHLHDITGQSPLELATNNYKSISKGLAEQIQVDAPFNRGQKKTFARTIIEAQHQLMIGFCFDGDIMTEALDDIERLWNNKDMDDKIVDIWVDNYSAAAMHDYINIVLDTDLNGIFQKMQSSILEAYCNYGKAPCHKDTADTTHSRPTARRVIAKLYPCFAERRGKNKLAETVLHQLPIRDLHRIAAYCETPWGKVFCAGRQEAAQREGWLLQRFTLTLREAWSIERGRVPKFPCAD